MFTNKETMQRIRKHDKPLAIWLWHEETLAALQARLRSLKMREE